MNQKTEELLSRVLEKANAVADYTTQKANQVIDHTKQSYHRYELNNKISAAERRIGQLVYAAHTGHTVEQSELDDLLKQLEDLNREADELRAKRDTTDGKKVCPKCGRVCGVDDVYCAACGVDLGGEQ